MAKALELSKASSGGDAASLLEETRRVNAHIARKDTAKALPAAKEEAKAALRSRFVRVDVCVCLCHFCVCVCACCVNAHC